jgi:hypothetical protein
LGPEHTAFYGWLMLAGMGRRIKVTNARRQAHQ